MKRTVVAVVALAMGLAAGTADAQDANYVRPVAELETRLRDGPLNIISFRGARAEGDRTQQIALQYPDSVVILAQLAKALPGASVFNNEPRYELAAYELQKLFLEPDDYVVPPTVIRSVPLEWLKQHDESARPTFGGTSSVVVVLQYWLLAVTPDDFYDRDRAREDSVYARYLGNFNILTYLIHHSDANVGNFLLSRSATRPRVFSVDNGVAFDSPPSNRGDEWRRLRVERLPRATIERLRQITLDQLRERLEVLIEFEIRDSVLEEIPVRAVVDAGRGVRRKDDVVQFGLTGREIERVANRLRDLLEDVDRGRIEVF